MTDALIQAHADGILTKEDADQVNAALAHLRTEVDRLREAERQLKQLEQLTLDAAGRAADQLVALSRAYGRRIAPAQCFRTP